MTAKVPKEIRRKEILNAAMRCFLNKGYHASTIDDISNEAGITKGGIYWHFESKNEIFMAILEEHKKQVHSMWEKAGLESISESTMSNSGLDFLRKNITNEWISSFIGEIEVEALRNEKGREDYLTFHEDNRDEIKKLLQESFEKGAIRKIDFESAATIQILMVEGLSRLYRMSNSELDYVRVWKVFSNIFMNGIEKK